MDPRSRLKNKSLITTTLVLLLIVNLSPFWEGKLGIWAFPVFTFLVILFLVLAIICLIQIIKGFQDNFSNRSRNWTIGIMMISLVLIFLKPGGFLNFGRLEGEDLFVAQREGAANCMTTFILKPNNKFKERNVCFGISETQGNYEIKNDTIFFSDVNGSRGDEEYYEFAILKKSKYRDERALFRYRSKSDTIGRELWITKNEIITNTQHQ